MPTAKSLRDRGVISGHGSLIKLHGAELFFIFCLWKIIWCHGNKIKDWGGNSMSGRTGGITKLETVIVLIAFVVIAAIFVFAAISTGVFISEEEIVDVTKTTMESGPTFKGADAVLEADSRRPDFLSQNGVPASEELVLIVEDWGRLFSTSWAPEGLVWSHLRHYDKAIKVPGGNFVPSDIRLGNEYRVLVGLAAPDGVVVDHIVEYPFAEEMRISLEKGVTQVVRTQ